VSTVRQTVTESEQRILGCRIIAAIVAIADFFSHAPRASRRIDLERVARITGTEEREIARVWVRFPKLTIMGTRDEGNPNIALYVLVQSFIA